MKSWGYNLHWSLFNDVVSEVSIRQQLQHNHDLVFFLVGNGCSLYCSSVVISSQCEMINNSLPGFTVHSETELQLVERHVWYEVYIKCLHVQA